MSAEDINNKHHGHVWIQGRVRQHAFIPAHLHHFFIPQVIVHHHLVKGIQSDVYGGFGAGANFGGQGAGHGYQAVYSDV